MGERHTAEDPIKVGDRVWLDRRLGYEQHEAIYVRAIEHGAALLPGAGWFDLTDLIREPRHG